METHLLARTLPGALLLGALTAACATIDTAAVAPDEEPVLADVADDATPVAEPDEALPCLTGDGVFYVTTDDPKLPLTRYADGQLSMSNSCGIRMENKLNRKIPPVYVNGRPIGFC